MTQVLNNNGPVAWEPMVYTPQSTFMEKTVEWYKKTSESKDHPYLNIVAKVLFVAAAIFCSLALITIPLVISFTAKLFDYYKEEVFYQDAANREPPPIDGHVIIDTKTQSSNHLSSYVIHNGIIWYKRKVDDYGHPVDDEWHPIYFDARPNLKPVELRVDGANLIVIDNYGEVHYKKAIKEKFNDVEAFNEMIESKRKPSIKNDILVATKKQCFDDENSYVIHDGYVWYKANNDEDAEWEAIYVPLKYDYYGKPQISAEEIKIDGDGNLVVVDNLKGEHPIKKENLQRTENYYSVVDKSTKNNWKEKWFSLPVLNHIVNFFTGNKLHLPDFTKAWAIGHRGQYNHYIEDRDGNKHPVATGVTNFYVLHKNGQYIYLYDPWKPKNVKIKIPIPGTADSPFIAENISVSGNTIMLIGYRYMTKKDGTIYKKPEVLTMIADVDSLAWNPGIKYTYFSDDHKKDNEFRVMPTAEKGFVSHPLPKGEITSGITILQTGEGNDAREMRIAGKNDKGESGYWYKMIKEGKWKFVPDTNLEQYEVMTTQNLEEDVEMPKPIVHNWRNDDLNVTLENFGNECITGKLKFGNAELLLHRKENIIVKILTNGKKFRHYDLVLPEGVDKDELPEELQPFFDNRRVIRVKVTKKEIEKNGQKELLLHIKEVAPNITSRLKIELKLA